MCLAVPGQLIGIWGADLERCGLVDFGSVRREVSLAFVPDAAVGDFVIVHVGVAIARLDQAAAERALDELAAAGVV